jgi:hypothetical protein
MWSAVRTVAFGTRCVVSVRVLGAKDVEDTALRLRVRDAPRHRLRLVKVQAKTNFSFGEDFGILSNNEQILPSRRCHFWTRIA